MAQNRNISFHAGEERELGLGRRGAAIHMSDFQLNTAKYPILDTNVGSWPTKVVMGGNGGWPRT